MQIPFDRPFDHEYNFCVFPNEIDLLANTVRALNTDLAQVQGFDQVGGRTAWAFTFGNETGGGKKRRLFVSRPHAHEPAGTAACAELIRVLSGLDDRWRDWRDQVLSHFIITLMPDANPQGSQRAPVKFWDGSRFPNAQFFLWMFGESGDQIGERFPRVACWDKREVTPPALLGIAYEQIDDFVFVEPNRDYRSTFFKSFFELDKDFHYDVWLDLHQTEFVNSDRNAEVHLPTCLDDLPAEMQMRHRYLADAIHARWQKEGAFPKDAPVVPYRNNDTQRTFLNQVWRPISERMVHLVTEVQNNNVRTPIAMQVHLQLVAILETLDGMLTDMETT